MVEVGMGILVITYDDKCICSFDKADITFDFRVKTGRFWWQESLLGRSSANDKGFVVCLFGLFVIVIEHCGVD